MYFGKIKIKNFCTIKSLEIDLSRNGFFLIEGENQDCGGSNESGKSTIARALCYCWFENYPENIGRATQEILNPKTNGDCVIESELYTDSGKYTGIRKRNRNGKEKDFQVLDENGENIVKKKDPNKVVEELLGLDYETFVRSNFFPQENIEPFTKMKDRGLKSFFLERLLNIQWIEDAYQRVKEDKQNVEGKLQKGEQLLNSNYDNRLECFDRINDLREQQSEWEKNKREKKKILRQELREVVKFYRDERNFIKQKEERIEDLEGELSEIIGDDLLPIEITNRQKEITQAEMNVKIICNQIDILEAKKNECVIKTEKANDKIGEKCNECGSIITEEHIPHLTQSYGDEILDINNKQETLENDLGNAIFRENNLKASLVRLQKEAEKYKEQEEKRNLINVQLAGLRGRTRYNDLVLKREQVFSKSKSLKLLKNEQSPFFSLIEKEQQRISLYDDDIKDLHEQISELQKEKEKIDFWYVAFSPKGIQSYLLDSITPIINKCVAQYLMELADGRISARFTTVKRLKSGEFRENFGLEITNKDGANTYVSLSGGAKKRVDIACSLAIGDFKRSLSNKELKFLCLDEVTSGVDEYWNEKFLAMIKKRFQGYSCYYITHQPVPKVLFDGIITIIKKEGETFLKNEND